MPHHWVKTLSCKCKVSVQIHRTQTKLCKCVSNPHAMTRQTETGGYLEGYKARTTEKDPVSNTMEGKDQYLRLSFATQSHICHGRH